MPHLIISLIVVSLFGAVTCPAKVSGAISKDIPAINLINNSSFEIGFSTTPNSWQPQSWAGFGELTWDTQFVHSGARSVKVSTIQPDDVYWAQTVIVRSNTEYKLSGWIKTQNVLDSAQSVNAGANLSLLGGFTRTAGLRGTNDWTYVEIVFNSGASQSVTVAGRLGFYSGVTTGEAWFDDIRLESTQSSSYATFIPLISHPICDSAPNHPRWKILGLIYPATDFTFVSSGQQHHLIASMTPLEQDKAIAKLTEFVQYDIPKLTSCNMVPSVVIRTITKPLTALEEGSCKDYRPGPSLVAADRDPAFDSVITMWDGSGIDVLSGQPLSVEGCGYGWDMGTGQTYSTIHSGFLGANDRNVYKHEWGHSILFYQNAANIAPKPAVDNHISATGNSYVNCITGQPYVLEDETNDVPIPNSIYNNVSGFTHDYYSGQTARSDQPSRCIGITPTAWAAGGPVTRSTLQVNRGVKLWRAPANDTILGVEAFWP